MNTLGIVKTVTSIVVSTGIGNIVGNLIKHTTPDNIKLPIKVITGIGGFALAGWVSVKTAEMVNSELDESVDFIKKIVGGKIEVEVDVKVVDDEPKTKKADKPARTPMDDAPDPEES